MNFTTAHVKLLWPSPKLLHQNTKTKGLLMHTMPQKLSPDLVKGGLKNGNFS